MTDIEQIAEIFNKHFITPPYWGTIEEQKIVIVEVYNLVLQSLAEGKVGMERISDDSIVTEASKDATYCQLSVDIGNWAANKQLAQDKQVEIALLAKIALLEMKVKEMEK